MRSFGILLLSLGLGVLANQGLMQLTGEASAVRPAWAADLEPTPLESLGALAAVSGGAFLLMLGRERKRGNP